MSKKRSRRPWGVLGYALLSRPTGQLWSIRRNSFGDQVMTLNEAREERSFLKGDKSSLEFKIVPVRLDDNALNS